jgi:hypothetical protein
MAKSHVRLLASSGAVLSNGTSPSGVRSTGQLVRCANPANDRCPLELDTSFAAIRTNIGVQITDVDDIACRG